MWQSSEGVLFKLVRLNLNPTTPPKGISPPGNSEVDTTTLVYRKNKEGHRFKITEQKPNSTNQHTSFKVPPHHHTRIGPGCHHWV